MRKLMHYFVGNWYACFSYSSMYYLFCVFSCIKLYINSLITYICTISVDFQIVAHTS